MPMNVCDDKLITCVLPPGVAMPVLRALKDEMGVVSANVSNARGVGKLSASVGRGAADQTEKQVLSVVVPTARADEIFAFLYGKCGIDQPHAGLMYMHPLLRACEFTLPDLPEEE